MKEEIRIRGSQRNPIDLELLAEALLIAARAQRDAERAAKAEGVQEDDHPTEQAS